MKFGYIVILISTLFVSGSMAVSQTSSGTQEYGDGGAYDGEFLNGLPHGNGTYELPNGYRYVGEWFEDNMNGQGTFTLVDGTVLKGIWKNSCRKSLIVSGEMEILLIIRKCEM